MKSLFNSMWMVLLVFAVACSSTPPVETGENTFTNAIDDDQYVKLVDNYSAKDEKYSGFYSTFQYQATILNASVLEGQLAIKAKDFKWSRESYFGEKEKVSQSLANESQIFLSFFTPVTENDNLESNKTVWKLWLVVDGTRYEGVATRPAGILAQHQRLYPYHTRFFTPYVLKFKIPMGKTQASNARLIITGPVGTSEVDFPPSSQVAQ